MTADGVTRNPRPVGLRAYEVSERLYGRDWERRSLGPLLLAERLTLFYSPSGAGKTSLIQAGLIVDLKQDTRLRVLDRTIRVGLEPPDWARAPGRRLNRYLLSTLISIDDSVIERPEQIGTLPDALRAALGLDDPEGADRRPLVIVFDQFEQILTSDPHDVAAKSEFFATIGALLENPRLWVVFVIREDFLAGLDPYLSFLPNRLRARFRLDLLDPAGARQVLQQTADESNAEFAEEAADYLVDELRRLQGASRPAGPQGAPAGDGQPDDAPTLSNYVEPLHLQVVYERIWRACGLDGPRSAERRVISRAEVERFGKVDEALASYYDDRVAFVAGETGESEREIRGWIEQQLITEDGMRNQVRRGDKESAGMRDEVVQKLMAEEVWLVRAEQRRQMTWLELAHDRLTEPILRSNAAWRERLQQFQRQADLWRRRGRPAELLLGRADFQAAQRWAEENPAAISPTDRAFLSECKEFLGANLNQHQRQAEVWRDGGRRDGLLLDGPTLAEAEAWARGSPQEVSDLDRLFLDESRKALRRQVAVARRTNLGDLGWYIVFPATVSPEVVSALQPLMEHRRAQAGRGYREFLGREQGYSPGETAQAFLRRVGLGASSNSSVRPYILLVGHPIERSLSANVSKSEEVLLDQIPLSLQYDLAALGYPVGRAAFDTPAEYRRYAEALVRAETGGAPPARRAAFFATQHEMDIATKRTMEVLVQPLLAAARSDTPGWQIGDHLGPEATRGRLGELLGEQHPDLLFLAAYGMGLRAGDSRQLDDQGAIICADWPGFGSVRREHWFGGEDVGPQDALAGLVAFLFAPFGAGTTRLDDMSRSGKLSYIANHDFIARLPQRMLAAGALAVIGHVNLNLTTSFYDADDQSAPDISLYRQLIEKLAGGSTVGSAMDAFTERSRALTLKIAEHLIDTRARGELLDEGLLQGMIIQRNDVRNYIILGDPAARLRVDEE